MGSNSSLVKDFIIFCTVLMSYSSLHVRLCVSFRNTYPESVFLVWPSVVCAPQQALSCIPGTYELSFRGLHNFILSCYKYPGNAIFFRYFKIEMMRDGYRDKGKSRWKQMEMYDKIVLDYISGMTDTYARTLYRELSGFE